MTAGVRILLISGSTRSGSGNTAALRRVQALAPPGITALMYDGLAALPACNPNQDQAPPRQAAGLREQIAAADALLFCTPEYAGTLPGSLKNLLDWTVGGGEIYGKPVAWINVAAGGRGTGAMRLTGNADGTPSDRDRAVTVLRRALELGVNHIDTAAFYFSALRSASELINRALTPYPDDLVITTKVWPGRDPSDEWVWATPQQLRGQVQENLRQLGRDHLDVVNLRPPRW